MISALISVLASIVANVITQLTVERAPALTAWLVRAAALRLVITVRQRYWEEWQADVDELLMRNQPTEALRVATGIYLWHARSVARTVGRGPSRVEVWFAAFWSLHYRKAVVTSWVGTVGTYGLSRLGPEPMPTSALVLFLVLGIVTAVLLVLFTGLRRIFMFSMVFRGEFNRDVRRRLRMRQVARIYLMVMDRRASRAQL